MTIDESAKLALKAFKEVLGEDDDINRFNISYIYSKTGKLRKLNKEEIARYD